MKTGHRAVGPLRILLATAFAAMVVAQVLAVAGVIGQLVESTPQPEYLRWPILSVSVVQLVCVQVVIVCTWKLLTLVKDDRIFSDSSLVWVDAIVWAIAVVWVLLLGEFLYFLADLGLSGLPALLFVMLVAGAVLGLLMMVMRALLQQATTLRTDMEAVI